MQAAGVLTIYGIVALSHLVIEIVLGHIGHLRQRGCEPAPERAGSVTVVVPVYNEPVDTLRACLESVACQDHRSVEVIVVDDGSANQAEHAGLYQRFARLEGWTVIQLDRNVGKRAAHEIAFERATGEFIVTIDSDTELIGSDALRGILRRFADPRVGAVTGYVAVRNANQNLLTRLIGVRYWMAFHQERAAQSLFGVMLCCSGPFSGFRRVAVERVRADYVGQRFLGRSCAYGDDRHLTNLILRDRWRVVFDEHTTCLTEVPSTVPAYARQQVRWNKSFYREALWSVRHLLFRRSPYLLVEISCQLMLPFCLLGALGVICASVLTGDPGRLGRYVAAMAAIGLLRALYGLVRTRDRRFLVFALYGLLHVLVLIPVRFYALATIRDQGWGTRKPPLSRHRLGLPSWASSVCMFLPGAAVLSAVSAVMLASGAVAS